MMNKLKVLYLDDSELDAEAVSRKLEEEKIDYKLYHVTNNRDLLNTLQFTDIDIILADYSLTAANSSEILEIVRREFAEIPFIILSGITGEDIVIDLLKKGATDFILKDKLGRLIPAIRRALLESREKAKRMKEEDLRKKYDFIINASKSMFSLVDSNYVYEAVNDAFCRAHNLVRDQVIGKSLAEVWGEEVFRKYIKKNFDRSFSNNVVRYQAWFEVPRFGLRCFEVTFYPYAEKGSSVTHTVVDTMDITDRQKAEDAIIDNEARYRTLFDQSFAGIFLVKDNKIQACNSKAAGFFGCERNKLLNKDPFFYSAEFQPDGSSSVTRAAEVMKKAGEGDPVSFNWTYKKLNGQEFLAQVNISRFKLKGEAYFQFFIEDITEKVRSAEMRIQLETAIEQSAELVFITDVEGKLKYVNNAFTETTGYIQEELLGMSFEIIFEGKKDNEYFQQIKNTLLEKRFWSGNITLRGKNNRKVEVYSTVSPIRNLEGRISNYVLVSRDITEELKIQTYLQRVEKMETIGRLAGGIAHDFNNILTTIIGHSDMALKDVPEGSPVKDDLLQILKATDRAKGLVNQILTFSRQVDQKDTVVNPVLLTNEILKLLSASLPGNIRIVHNADKDCPAILADPSHLHQVVMNILTNGIYAMKEKGGTLNISIQAFNTDRKFVNQHPALNEGKYVKMTFEDTGKGMDDMVMERIFEPFFTTKPVGEGTGLGLSVVHGIVKNLKGEILVDSTPGKGSTFTVLLPAIK
jgi:PAS domain S-box-containing protein